MHKGFENNGRSLPALRRALERVVRLSGRRSAGPAGRSAGRWAAGLGQAGMATAEYAIATLAACGFAGLLLTILKSGEVKGMLLGIVRRALSV